MTEPLLIAKNNKQELYLLPQMANRHALRAFSPRDQKAVKVAAETMRVNPKLDEVKIITELGVGEALVSCMDEKGIHNIVERALIAPPQGQFDRTTKPNAGLSSIIRCLQGIMK
jgi:DNA helicase HerA-like ATPase